MDEGTKKVKLEKAIRFIKWQSKHNRNNLDKETDPRKVGILQDIAKQHDETISTLEDTLSSAPPCENLSHVSNLEEIENRVALRPKDISGLPDELIEQLSFKKKGDDVEIAIQEIIDAAGGVMSLDQIIIAYYRKTDKVLKRNLINAKLYRMAKKGLLYPVKGKKGIYCIFDPSTLNSEDRVVDE